MHLWTATQLFVAGAIFYTSLSSTRHPHENATRDSLARLSSQSILHPRVIPVDSVQWRHDSGTMIGVNLALLVDLPVGDRRDGGD